MFEDQRCKFRAAEAAMFLEGEPDPGRFRARRKMLWLEHDEQDFWSTMWSWKHKGSTGNVDWDHALERLRVPQGSESGPRLTQDNLKRWQREPGKQTARPSPAAKQSSTLLCSRCKQPRPRESHSKRQLRIKSARRCKTCITAFQ